MDGKSAPSKESDGLDRGRKYIYVIFLSLISGLALLTCVYTYHGRYNSPPIRSDGFGYYVYLPAIFIYNDIHFHFIDQWDQKQTLKDYDTKNLTLWSGLSKTDRGYVDKYPIGTALLETPFFLLALGASSFFYKSPNGFESIFQYANVLSSIFYLCFGSLLLLKVALRLTSALSAVLVVTLGIFCTNVLHYGSYDGSFSHIYSFFLACVAMYLVVDERAVLSIAAYYGLLGAVIGLATIVRPTNALWAFLVFIGLPDSPADRVRSGVAFALCAAALTLPQVIVWYITTGSAIFYSYGEEGFNFRAPEIFNYLFSVRKGMFFWQPAYFLLSIGTVVACLRRRYEAIPLLAVVIITDYVNASWHSWWFGGSFGARPAVDTLPLLVAGSCLALPKSWRAPKLILIPAAVATIVLAAVNLTQMQGYIVHAIDFDGTTLSSYLGFWRRRLLL